MKKERCSDADYANSIVAKYSANARNTGKLIAVIVLILSLIRPQDCKTAFVLAMTYIGLEYIYSISITVAYKHIIHKYFIPIEDGFAAKEGSDASELSRCIANYGTIQMIINAIILMASVVCLL